MATKACPFRAGDRVRDTTGFFGTGTFERYDVLLECCMVTWDRRPPKEYNMGANPCIVDPAHLAPMGATDNAS